jgi:Xaa-Pro aminopeptidase
LDIRVSKAELDERLSKFIALMNVSANDWDTAFIIGKVNQYYFTGTMQDGLLIVKRTGGAFYCVRRSFERAGQESGFDGIYAIESYRDAAAIAGADCGNVYIETEVVTFGITERLKKAFNMDKIASLDKIIMTLRSVKSPYELYWMEQSGKAHVDLLHNSIPNLLQEGMSEIEFGAELFREMMRLGYQGMSRFSMFQTEMVVGQIGFGDSSLAATNFDGPGGGLGMYPAVPILGSRERRLKKGDLVFADIAFGMNGYHTDKTQVFMFGATPSADIVKAHEGCINVQRNIARLLRPGAIPAIIYNDIMLGLSEDFKNNFMGFGSRKVKFLGHGVGLHIDEFPVIANGFKEPLVENMVIALEPKKGVVGIGMVGVEDTYLVTPEGGRCITGGGSEIIAVKA